MNLHQLDLLVRAARSRGLKWCGKCQQFLMRKCFNKDDTKGEGLSVLCKLCSKAYSKSYREGLKRKPVYQNFCKFCKKPFNTRDKNKKFCTFECQERSLVMAILRNKSRRKFR